MSAGIELEADARLQSVLGCLYNEWSDGHYAVFRPLSCPHVGDERNDEWHYVRTRDFTLLPGCDQSVARETTDEMLTDLLTTIERLLRESPYDYVGFTLPVVQRHEFDCDHVNCFAYSHLRRKQKSTETEQSCGSKP